MPTHAHEFEVGMGAILLFMGGMDATLLFMGGHGCAIIGNVTSFEYMGAI